MYHTMHTAIAVPVKNRAWLLHEFLEAISNIRTEDKISYVFIDDCSIDNSLSLLQKFGGTIGGTTVLTNQKAFDNNKSSRDVRDREALYRHLASIRNTVLSKCRDLEVDRVFMLDSDILVVPDILSQLEQHKAHYCSTIINNVKTITPQDIYKKIWYDACNILSFDKKLNDYKHKDEIQINSETCCDVSGACFLISGDILYSDIIFDYHKYGEDIPYCQQIRQRNIPIVADTTIKAVHVFLPQHKTVALSTYRELLNNKRKGR